MYRWGREAEDEHEKHKILRRLWTAELHTSKEYQQQVTWTIFRATAQAYNFFFEGGALGQWLVGWRGLCTSVQWPPEEIIKRMHRQCCLHNEMLFTAYGTLSPCSHPETVRSPCSVRPHTISRSPTEGRAVMSIQIILSDMFLPLDLSSESCTSVAHGHGELFIWRRLSIILPSTCMVLHLSKASLRSCCLLQWRFFKF